MAKKKHKKRKRSIYHTGGLTWARGSVPKVGEIMRVQPRDRRRKPVLYKVTAVSKPRS